MQNYEVHAYVISMEFSAVNRRRTSPKAHLGQGAKKDGCFRRLAISEPTSDPVFILIIMQPLQDLSYNTKI